MLIVRVSLLETGEWLAWMPLLQEVEVRAGTKDKAVKQAKVAALKVLLSRVERGEPCPPLFTVVQDATGLD